MAEMIPNRCSLGITGLKVSCEKEVFWRINSFNLIVDDEELIGLQKFTFVSEETPKTKWRMYLSKSTTSEDKILVYYRPKEFKFTDGATIFHRMQIFIVEEERGVERKIGQTGVTLTKMSLDDDGSRRISPKATLASTFGPQIYNTFLWKGGALVLKLKLEIYEKTEEVRQGWENAQSIKKLEDNAKLRYLKLLESGEHSDCKIISCDGREFNAHKLILRAGNDVFDAMFRNDMLESQTGTIKLDDLSGEAVKFLLHFIYISEVLPFSLQSESEEDNVNMEDQNNTTEDGRDGHSSGARPSKRARMEKQRAQVSLEEVLHLASKYEFNDLLNFVSQKMESMCNQGDALRLLELAKKYSLNCKSYMKEFVKKNDSVLDILLEKD